MPKRPFAAARIAALALVVLSLSVAGHSAESAALPGPIGLALTLVLSIGLTSAALARPRSMAWLVVYLAGTQAVIHGVLVVSGSNHHPGSAALVPLLPSGMMVAGHLAASLAAAAVLAYGEQTLLAWVRLLAVVIGPRITARLPISVAPATPFLVVPFSVCVSDADWSLARRGPPTLVSV